MQAIRVLSRQTVFIVVLLFFCTATARAGWQPETNVPTTDQLRGIDGYDASNIFAVGNYGTILKYDGTSWQNVSGITEKSIYGVWWASAHEAFAVCDKGAVLRFDGTTWAAMDSGTTQRLREVWGTARNDVFAVGENGTLLHYDGTSWKKMTSPTPLTLQSVWGASSSDVYAVGGASGTGGTGSGVIIHYDGRQWTTMTQFVIPRLQDVWGVAGKIVFSVGETGTIFSLVQGATTWTEMQSGTTETLRDVWGSSEQDVYAVGDYGTMLHYDGTAWSPVTSGTTLDLFGIWGSSKNNAVAVGREGLILHYSEGSDDNGTDTCPFLVALDSADDLQLLRDFRDTRLKKPAGIDVVSLFYEHAAEAATVIRRSPGMQQQLAALVAANRQTLSALVAGDTGHITGDMVLEIIGFLRELQSRGGVKLAIVLDGVLHGLEHGWLLDLLDIRVE